MMKAQMNGTSTESLTILVADDEDEIRTLLTHWLERVGHRIDCAASGQEASRLLRQKSFDMVITDVVMPDGDGYELIAEVRRLQPRSRIVAISGGGKYLQGADCLKIARGLGAHSVVMKPFNWEQLQTGMISAAGTLTA